MPKQTKNNQAGNKAKGVIAGLEMMRHFDRPINARNWQACIRWQRKFAGLAEIRAEIAPRIPAEILPDIVPPLVRFASRRATDQGEAQADSRFALSGGEFEHSVGIYDRDETAGGEEREIAPVLPVEPVEKEVSE